MIKNKRFSFGFRLVTAVILALSFLAISSDLSAAGRNLVRAHRCDGCEVLIKLLHTNDVHSNLNGFVAPLAGGATEEVAGVARIAAFFENGRRANPNTLCLSAGDDFQGTLFFNFFRGSAEIEAMNASRYDVSCPGNHEFDEGSEWLLKVAAPAAFDVVNCNLEFDPAVHPTASARIRPYVIKKIAGVNVAITGAISHNLANLVGPKSLKGVSVADPAAVLAKLVPELRKKADIVVLLSHCGHDADLALAAAVPGIDAIIGGHSHTKLEKPAIVNGPSGRPVVVSQAFEKGELVGELNFAFCPQQNIVRLVDAKYRRMDSTVPKDAAVQKIVDRFAGQISQQVMKVVGTAVRQLVGERDIIRSEETNLGDLLSDIFLDYAKADMAVINGGCIRASIQKGDIKIADCINTFPFNQPVCVMKIRGKHIKSAFDYVAKMSSGLTRPTYKNERQTLTVVYPNGGFAVIEVPAETGKQALAGGKFGGFLQVSRGVRVAYKNGAVEELTLNGAPFEDEKVYTLATSDFTANGGDGFTMFNLADEKQTFGNMTDIFVEAVRTMKIIDVGTEGRIRN